MKTSQQWWNEVKADPVKFNDWLVKQYRGEATAADRIVSFAEQFTVQGSRDQAVLTTIAWQELLHATWIKQLLLTRGLDNTSIEGAENRYWKETLPGIESFETGAAVAAHAEKMRLERIQVIASDEEAPEDVREVFKKILRDELFHERAFREMAGDVAYRATEGQHHKGMEALGLVA